MDTDCIICYENDDLVQLKDIYGCDCVKPIHKKCYEGIKGNHTYECLMCRKLLSLSKLKLCKLMIIAAIHDLLREIIICFKQPSFRLMLIMTILVMNISDPKVDLSFDKICDPIYTTMQFASSIEAKSYCDLLIAQKKYEALSKALIMKYVTLGHYSDPPKVFLA